MTPLYTYNKETSKYEYSKEGIQKRTEYNKENYSCVSFSMKPDEYEIFKAAADADGEKFAGWVQKACMAMIEE